MKPIVLQGVPTKPFREGERIEGERIEIACGACGHIMILRKYPDKRQSRLRCGMCKIKLIWTPTEEEALAAVRRAGHEGVIYGREKGEGK